VVDVATAEATRLTEDPAADEHPVWSPDGSSIIFESATEEGRDLLVMAPDGSGVRPLVDAAGNKSDADFSPDGARLGFSMEVDGNADIYLVNVDGSGLQRLTDRPSIEKTPRWSPEGRLIAFLSDQANITPTPRPTAENETPTPRPSRVPAGAVIQFDVYVMNADGSGQARITPDDWQDSDPVWRPIAQ
jgi:TolB protein